MSLNRFPPPPDENSAWSYSRDDGAREQLLETDAREPKSRLEGLGDGRTRVIGWKSQGRGGGEGARFLFGVLVLRGG